MIIKIGQMFRAWGSDWKVKARQRGRVREDRTMYVIERSDGHRETRCRSTLLRVL